MADYDHCEVHHLTHPCEACAVELGVRDQFAMAAMQGLLANPGGPIQANGMSGWNFTNCDKNDVAKLAYILADAMLHERTAGVTVDRVGPEGWKRLAESLRALGETDDRIKELAQRYGLDGDGVEGRKP